MMNSNPERRAYEKLTDARGRVNAADKAVAEAAKEMTLALDELAERTDEYIQITEGNPT